MGWNYCKTCRGNGEVQEAGSHWWWPRHIVCPTCDGKRYAKPGPRPEPPPPPPPRQHNGCVLADAIDRELRRHD